MPILFKSNIDPKPSRVYPLREKDRDVINIIFDNLYDKEKIVWINYLTRFSYLVFVVQRDTPKGRKNRVIVNIRKLNRITELDTYPMPLQSDIIAAIAGYKYITVVDTSRYFYQFRIKLDNRYKLIVVSHKKQKQFNIAIIGYKGSPFYIQRQTDTILRPFRKFVKAFIDDIVIFLNILEEHIYYLRQVFGIFKSKNISLLPKKSYLGFPSVILLRQYIDSLGYTISEEKV